MNAVPTCRRPCRTATGAVACMVAAAMLGVACDAAFAQAQSTSPLAATRSLPSRGGSGTLERAFWACDHAATRRGLDSGEAMACGVVSESLKNARFGGDLDAMLDWWRENRAAEYRELDAAGRGRARR